MSDHVSPGSRENQFGAIGTKRDVKQTMPYSVSPQFPIATTAAAINSTGTSVNGVCSIRL